LDLQLEAGQTRLRTLRTRVAAHARQNINRERAFFARMSPRVLIALLDLREELIQAVGSRKTLRAKA
jgi:hypothetical protein